MRSRSFQHISKVLLLVSLALSGCCQGSSARTPSLSPIVGHDSAPESGDAKVTEENTKRPLSYQYRSPCPPNSDPLECRDDMASERHRTPFPDRTMKLLKFDTWTNLCPQSTDIDRCIEKYSSWLNKSFGRKKRTARAVEFIKRDLSEGSMLCPDSMNKAECFENYMVAWMHMIRGLQEGRFSGLIKRSPIWKRKLCARNPSKCLNTILDPGASFTNNNGQPVNVELASSYPRGPTAPCAGAGSQFDCLRSVLQRLRKLETANWNYPSGSVVEKRGHLVSDLCPPGFHPIHCFDHYLAMVAKSSESRNPVSKFVG